MAQVDPQIERHNCVEVFDKAEEPERCRCKGIVLNAVGEMRKSGMCERDVIQAATRILRYHHPSPSVEAKTVVECWMFEASHSAAH